MSDITLEIYFNYPNNPCEPTMAEQVSYIEKILTDKLHEELKESKGYPKINWFKVIKAETK